MNQVQNELRHYGVLGMKWGKHKAKVSAAVDKRRAKETEFRQKMTNIQKNKSVNPSDLQRFEYRNQSAAARIGKTAVSVTSRIVVKEMLQHYLLEKKIDKKTIRKDAMTIAVNTASQVAIKDAMAKSAAKRYTDSGKKVAGVSNRLVTKEDLITVGLGVGVKAAYVGMTAGSLKMSQVVADRKKNEATFNAWGARVLPQSVNRDILWVSDDGDTSVIRQKRTWYD